MIVLGPLALFGVAVAAVPVVRAVRSARSKRRDGAPRTVAWTQEELARWVAAGLITKEQASAIPRLEETAHAPLMGLPVAPPPSLPVTEPGPRDVSPVPRSRTRRVGAPVVAEALGYLGAVLAVTELVLLVARNWQHMTTGGRLGLCATGALALLVVGLVVPEGPDRALVRLRSILWLASTAMTALFLRVLVSDGFGDHCAKTQIFAFAAGVVIESGLLSIGRPRPLQQIALLGAFAVSAGTGVADFAAEGWSGVAVWAVGVFILGIGISHRAAPPLIIEAVGAITIVAGSITTASGWQAFGSLLVLPRRSSLNIGHAATFAS